MKQSIPMNALQDPTYIRRYLLYTLAVIGIGWILWLLTVLGNDALREISTYSFLVLSVPTAWIAWRITFVAKTLDHIPPWVVWILRVCALIHIADWLIFSSLAAGWIPKTGLPAKTLETVFGTFPAIYFTGGASGAWFFATLAARLRSSVAKWIFPLTAMLMLLLLLGMGFIMIRDWPGYLEGNITLSRSYFIDTPSAWRGSGAKPWIIIPSVFLIVWGYGFYAMRHSCGKIDSKN